VTIQVAGFLVDSGEWYVMIFSASSEESVGDFWRREVPQTVIQHDLQCFDRTEAVRHSGADFCFFVQALYNAGRELLSCFEPVPLTSTWSVEPSGPVQRRSYGLVAETSVTL
jgi:hypothetical protein